MEQETQQTTDTVPHEEPPVQTTLSVPFEVWKAVKNLSTERRTSQLAIWIEAMRAYLKDAA